MTGVDVKRLKARIQQQWRSPRDVSLKATGNPYIVRDILSGKVRNPRSDTLQAIAEELGVEMKELMIGGATEPVQATRKRQIVPTFLRTRYLVKAGFWQELEYDEPPEQTVMAVLPSPKFANWPQWLELVEGDSCNLKIPDGHYIHVVDAREMGYAPKTNDFVVVERWRDQGAIRERTVKQIEILEDGSVRLWPRSNNPRWKDFVDLREGQRSDTDEIEAYIVGLVIGAYDPNF